MPRDYYKVEGYTSLRSIGYLLRRNSKLLTNAVEALFVKQDVSFVQWVVLMHLREKLATTSAELSECICHDSGALTRLIDGLEQRGLVQRTRSQQDRRVIEIELTPEGRKVTESFLPEIVDLYNHLVGDFSVQEVDTLITLLTRLGETLSRLDDTAEG